jgi:hypothetical protein
MLKEIAMSGKRTLGFWVLIIPGFLILFMLIFGQMMAVIDYDFAVSIGLQEPTEVFSEYGVAMNKAFGVGDTIIYLPLLVLGLIGLWLKKSWGLFVMLAALAITAYWPVVHIFFVLFAEGLPGFNFTDFTSFITTLIVISVYGIWGMYYLYSHKNIFMD